jgi:thioredoxin-like negative regulator of GroEL
LTDPTTRCPSCGTLNRFPQHKSGMKAKCGNCGSWFTLPPVYGVPVDVTDAGFSTEVQGQPVPVVVFFWSPGCGHCLRMEPAVRELAAGLSGRAMVARLDVSANPATASAYGVTATPTFIVFKGGREASRFVGAMPMEELKGRLARFI